MLAGGKESRLEKKWLTKKKSLSICPISEIFDSFLGHPIGHSRKLCFHIFGTASIPYLIQIQLNFRAACVKPRVRLNFKKKEIRKKKEKVWGDG